VPPSFPNQNQGLVLRNPAQLLPTCAYGAITLYGRPFEVTSASLVRRRPGPQHHISHWFPSGIRFELFPFRSLLLREYLLVSLPPLTKMFPFRGFPLPRGSATAEAVTGSPIRASPDRRSHAPPRGLSRLATPFFGVRAKLFPRWRIISVLFKSPALN
jgi:hypothetical protein